MYRTQLQLLTGQNNLFHASRMKASAEQRSFFISFPSQISVLGGKSAFFNKNGYENKPHSLQVFQLRKDCGF